MVAGVVLVQIIKWEETMLCDMLNNEQLLYGYVILSLSKDLHGKEPCSSRVIGFAMLIVPNRPPTLHANLRARFHRRSKKQKNTNAQLWCIRIDFIRRSTAKN